MAEDNTMEVAVRGLCKSIADQAAAKSWLYSDGRDDLGDAAERKVEEATNKLLNMFRASEHALRLVADINDHQANPYVHSLTCGNDSDHGKLVPHWSVRLDKIVLRCPTCQLEQEHIPTLMPDATPMAQLVERLRSHYSADTPDGDVGC